MQGTINTFPTFTEPVPPEKKRRMSKKLILGLMAALAAACIVVANPAIANRVHTFSGVPLVAESTSSIVANVD